MKLKFSHFKQGDEYKFGEQSGIESQDKKSWIFANDTDEETSLGLAKRTDDGIVTTLLKHPDGSPQINDAESMARIGDRIFVVTSHAEAGPNTRRLVQIEFSPQTTITRITDMNGSYELRGRIKAVLLQSYPGLRGKYFKGDRFNIEGMARAKGEDALLLGLRGPLVNGKAPIVKLSGLNAAFDRDGGSHCTITPMTALNLNGAGIREITYVNDLNGYLIIAGKSTKGPSRFKCEATGKKSLFSLWYWDGMQKPRQVLCFPEYQDGIKIQPEGLAKSVDKNGEPGIIITSDDKESRYLLIKGKKYKKLKKRCLGKRHGKRLTSPRP